MGDFLATDWLPGDWATGSVPFALVGLWRFLPSVGPVDYVSVGTNVSPINLTLSAVVTTPDGKHEKRESYGKYIQRRTTIKIPQEVWDTAVTGHAGLAPKSRDTLTLDGVTWTVCAGINLSRNGGLYRLECDFFEPQFAIDDTVTFMNASCGGSSLAGDRHVTLTALGDPIECGIEPIRQEVDVDAYGAKTAPEYFDVYLSRDVTAANDPSVVRAGALIQDQNAVQYEVLEVNDRERLDLETHLLCVRRL